ncbi:MAG TPA: B12-binding domain-containing radical SAM protein [Elusimicrobia bacterium]|nr:B12-binding domain-containing radical SAM protein [Elusimicrobiota bacterium]
MIFFGTEDSASGGGMTQKILLINPLYSDAANASISKSAWKAMPMGMLYLAAALEQAGHTVKFMDMEALRLTEADVRKALSEFAPTVVGLTAATPMIRQAVRLCRLAKELVPGAKTVIGGVHATILPEEVAGEACVDVVVRGEGERTAVELMEALFSGDAALERVQGITFKKDGRIVATPERAPIADLDTLPFPAWHLVRLGDYQHPLGRTQNAASVLTSRGCPFRCTFCSRGVFGRNYRVRSAESVLAELEALRSRYGVEEVYFVDDAFTIKRPRVESICGSIIAKGWKLHWATPNGVNVNTLDRDLLRLMKESGCYSLSFGIESGNPETLDRIHKGQTLDRVRAVFRDCRELDIETVAFIIIGFPNEDRAMNDNTLRFLKEIRPDVADIHTLIPLPGTAIFEELDRAGFILERDWGKYVFHGRPVFRTAHFSPEEIHREYKRVYLRYHLRPAYVLQRLRRIRSWEEVLNNLKGLWTLLSMGLRRPPAPPRPPG